MRDDLDKLPLPKSAKKYARMTSKDLGDDWSKKVDMYMDMAADLTNQSKEGFKNKDASGPVKHAFKESAEQIVARLLEDDELLNQMGRVATRPQELYRLAREALNFVFGEGQGMEAAINAALETVGISEVETKGGCPLAEFIADALSDIDTGGTPAEAVSYISSGIDEAVPDLETGYKWALMKIFTEEAKGIEAARREFEAEGGGMPESLGEGIKAAAVKCHDGTVIAGPKGADHIACCMMANQQGKSWDDEGLGFVTDEDRFVTRDEAEMIGMAHGQMKPGISDPGMVHARDFNWNESTDDLLGDLGSVADRPNQDYDALMSMYGDEDPGSFNSGRLIKCYSVVKITGLFTHKESMKIGRDIMHYLSEIVCHNISSERIANSIGRLLDEYKPELDPADRYTIVRVFRDVAARIRRENGLGESYGDRGYRYETCCVSADGGDISDMVDQAQDVSYDQFMRNVSIAEIFQSGIGYGYYWTPAQAVAAGVDYHEVARNRPLTLKKDWHVSYHRSVYLGKPCYFMVHSAIEYVFVKD